MVVPGLAQPQTGSLASRCKTMLSVKSGWSSGVVVTACDGSARAAINKQTAIARGKNVFINKQGGVEGSIRDLRLALVGQVQFALVSVLFEGEMVRRSRQVIDPYPPILHQGIKVGLVSSAQRDLPPASFLKGKPALV